MKQNINKRTASNLDLTGSSQSSKIFLNDEKRLSSDVEGAKISKSDSVSSASIKEPKVI